VSVAVAGSGQVTAAADGEVGSDAGADWGADAGVLSGAALGALGLGVAPDEHAPMAIIDTTRSAPTRFEVRTVTRNLLLAALRRGRVFTGPIKEWRLGLNGGFRRR
jgi:hypothetical protein